MLSAGFPERLAWTVKTSSRYAFVGSIFFFPIEKAVLGVTGEMSRS